MKKKALVLGIGGQDGSYLADELMLRGYEVHGLYRKSSVDNLVRLNHIRGITFHQGDVTDSISIRETLVKIQPLDMVFNVADQDNVGWSRKVPNYQHSVTFRAVHNLLYLCNLICPRVKIFQPLSVTMFGDSPPPQSEFSTVNPQSPYATEKLHAWETCINYRTRFSLNVTCGIMFNHDSPRRAPHYLLQDICRGALAIATYQKSHLSIGDLDAVVDVGYAGEFMSIVVDLMEKVPSEDYCIGTGMRWTIGMMVERAFDTLMRVHGRPVKDWKDRIILDPTRSGGPTYQADVTKLGKAIGRVPMVNTGEVIDKIINHLVRDGE